MSGHVSSHRTCAKGETHQLAQMSAVKKLTLGLAVLAGPALPQECLASQKCQAGPCRGVTAANAHARRSMVIVIARVRRSNRGLHKSQSATCIYMASVLNCLQAVVSKTLPHHGIVGRLILRHIYNLSKQFWQSKTIGSMKAHMFR